MSLNRFAKFAWFVVAYNILVILWGAFVRASGSGAGCGAHWPLCDGQVIPLNPSLERAIEFTHRGMSGIALLLVLGMLIWAFRAYPWGLVRHAAIASAILMLIEALIGAALVLFGWVGVDKSTARVFSIAAHLINTFLLLAALTLTAWWASGGKGIDLRARPIHSLAMAAALLGLMLTGAAGALTALGDTLFPASSLAEGIAQDVNPTAHFLVQLRAIHPMIAIAVGVYLLYLTVMLNGEPNTLTRKLAMGVRFLVIGQIFVGGLNVILLAPTWLQLVHLLIADVLWIALVLYAAALLAAESEPARESSTQPRVLKTTME